jgi:hypothetical protein
MPPPDEGGRGGRARRLGSGARSIARPIAAAKENVIVLGPAVARAESDARHLLVERKMRRRLASPARAG